MIWKQIINILFFVAQGLPIASSGKISSNKINRMSCRNEATFKAIDRGFKVKESSAKLISTTNVPFLPNCARSCIKASGCKSAIYKKNPTTATERNCQLLNVEKISLTNDDKQSSSGWIYYEPLHQVSLRI